jgi:hypothetical protein
MVPIGACVLTLLAFLVAYVPELRDVKPPRSLDYREVQFHLEKNEGFLQLDVNQVIDMRGEGQAEFVPLFSGGSHVYCEEPLLWGGTLKMEELVAGDVYLGWNERLNMYNPACFIYPEENDCSPGDRILVDDIENLEQFTTGQKTSWNVPLVQRLLNWISVLSLIVCIGILAVFRRK